MLGARPLKRFLQRHLETRLARALITGEVAEDSEITFTVRNDELAPVQEAAAVRNDVRRKSPASRFIEARHAHSGSNAIRHAPRAGSFTASVPVALNGPSGVRPDSSRRTIRLPAETP